MAKVELDLEVAAIYDQIRQTGLDIRPRTEGMAALKESFAKGVAILNQRLGTTLVADTQGTQSFGRSMAATIAAAKVAIASGTPTPGPTASAISPPVLSQTSTAGSAPFAFDIAIDGTDFVGYFWELQVSSTVAFGTGDTNYQRIVQQIQLGDMDGAVTFTGFATPVGQLYLRLRVYRDNGDGTFTYSNWSNVLHDTIAATYVAAFDPAKISFNTTLSNSNKTMAGVDQGYNQAALAIGDTPLSAATGYVEFTYAVPGSAAAYIGLDDGTISLNAGLPPRCRIMTAGYYYDGGGTNTGGSLASFPAGSTIGMLVHKATGRVWWHLPAGWANGAPAFNGDGTIASSSTGGTLSGLAAAIKFVAADDRSGSWVVNAGQAAFAYSVPANVNLGWA